jgi:hypothetical protein
MPCLVFSFAYRGLNLTMWVPVAPTDHPCLSFNASLGILHLRGEESIVSLLLS